MQMDACRLSYKGLGEPLCFLAFGPLATSAFYVAQVVRMAPTYHKFPDTLRPTCSCVLPLTSRMLPSCQGPHATVCSLRLPGCCLALSRHWNGACCAV